MSGHPSSPEASEETKNTSVRPRRSQAALRASRSYWTFREVYASVISDSRVYEDSVLQNLLSPLVGDEEEEGGVDHLIDEG